jgi:RNAse Z (EC 3.1.26.11)
MTCYGYSLSLGRAGKFNPDAARALEIPLPFWKRLQQGETITDGDKVYTPDMVMGEDRKGLKVTYVTDTRPIHDIVSAAKGSDLFICEGMYGEADGDEKAREKKHMTMYDAARLAKEAVVGQLWLTHYSPSMVNPFEFSDKVKRHFP